LVCCAAGTHHGLMTGGNSVVTRMIAWVASAIELGRNLGKFHFGTEDGQRGARWSSSFDLLHNERLQAGMAETLANEGRIEAIL
jgi:heme oxygenase